MKLSTAAIPPATIATRHMILAAVPGNAEITLPCQKTGNEPRDAATAIAPITPATCTRRRPADRRSSTTRTAPITTPDPICSQLTPPVGASRAANVVTAMSAAAPPPVPRITTTRSRRPRRARTRPARPTAVIAAHRSHTTPDGRATRSKLPPTVVARPLTSTGITNRPAGPGVETRGGCSRCSCHEIVRPVDRRTQPDRPGATTLSAVAVGEAAFAQTPVSSIRSSGSRSTPRIRTATPGSAVTWSARSPSRIRRWTPVSAADGASSVSR